MKTCIACGMPMNDVSDFALRDTSKEYCVHCTHSDGSMKSFEEKREDMINLMVKTQGFDKSAALELVERMMMKLPAWRGRFKGDEKNEQI